VLIDNEKKSLILAGIKVRRTEESEMSHKGGRKWTELSGIVYYPDF
jgi:hypothetical protein